MTSFPFRRTDRVRQTRVSRELNPAVDGFEPRRLLSTAAIGGAVLADIKMSEMEVQATPVVTNYAAMVTVAITTGRKH